MPNWDDDFDFDDLDQQPKKKQQKPAKKKDDDFFDLDEGQKKLPVINNRIGSGKNIDIPASRNSKNYNPYVEKMNLRDLNNDIEDQLQENIPNNSSKNIGNKSKQKKALNLNYVNNSKKQNDDEQAQFYEDVASSKVNNNSKQINKNNVGKQPEQQQEDDYGEDFQPDAYGDDFEEVQEEKKPPPKKKMMTIQSKPSVKIPIKPPSRRDNSQKPQINKPPLIRSNSKKSIKSVQRRPISRQAHGTHNTSVYVPNKYMSLVNKNFPQADVSHQNPDKLNKLNDRIRGMIKRLNDELNDLINKNMLQLKSKKNEKVITADDRIRILQEQRKNNEVAIERMENQYSKLHGRQGQLKEEEYQLITQRKIAEIKEQIKQATKVITKLKFQVNNQGNKLTRKIDEKKIAQQLQFLKNSLIQVKKEDQKGTQRIQKLQQKISNLNGKLTDVDYQLKQKIDEAKSKGIQLQSKQELIKKFEETKKRHEQTKNYKLKSENLFKTKSQIIMHEKQQLRISINNYQFQIKNLYNNITHSHAQSVKLVEKAKENPKINHLVSMTLDEILKSLEKSQNENFQFDNRSQSSRGGGNRPLKNSAVNNVEKSTPMRNNNSQNNQIDQNQGNKKPNFMRKKKNDDFNEADNKNQVYQRVWKQEEQPNYKQKQKVQELMEDKKEQDKKKPFSLKKNRLATENKNNQLNIDISAQKKQQPKQNQKTKQEPSIAGPKMMRFKKRNQQSSKNIQDNPNIPVQQPKIKTDKKQQVKEEEQPIIAPRRFNLRNKGQKKQDSYIPSIDKSIQEKKQEPKKQEYKPNFNFKVQDDYKPVEKIKQQRPINIQPEKQQSINKPAFNLRLRDKQKKQSNDIGGYNPTSIQPEKKQFNIGGPKQNINNPYTEKNSISNQYVPKQEKSNPYAPKQQKSNPYASKQEKLNPYAPKQEKSNPYAPKQQKSNPYAPKQEINNPYNPYANQENAARQKQGRIKKQKITSNMPKQKLNIYEQAEDLTIGNQFVNEPPKQELNLNDNNNKTEDLDLNAMLGIKKKQKNEFDDLINVNNNINDNKKSKRRNDDFFGDIDI